MVRSPQLAAVGIFLLALLCSTSTAVASLPTGAEREGARTLRAVEDGKRDCLDLSRGDLARVGDYAMGRVLGSSTAHAEMDRVMGRMMGERAQRRMHELMGRRFAGCDRGALAAGAMDMMGAMMGALAGPAAAARSGTGMMPGEQPVRGSGRADADDGDAWGGGAAMAVMTAALLAVTAAAVLWLRPRRATGAEPPREVLAHRYARGEIDGDEYRRRNEALGGNA